jgi:hypothetical protein
MFCIKVDFNVQVVLNSLHVNFHVIVIIMELNKTTHTRMQIKKFSLELLYLHAL